MVQEFPYPHPPRCSGAWVPQGWWAWSRAAGTGSAPAAPRQAASGAGAAAAQGWSARVGQPVLYLHTSEGPSQGASRLS